MSSEYINLKPFGMNVLVPKESKAAKHIFGKAVRNFWEPVMDYLEKNEDVFSGNIEKEIDKINIQTMNLGFASREGEIIHRLDTKG